MKSVKGPKLCPLNYRLLW